MKLKWDSNRNVFYYFSCCKALWNSFLVKYFFCTCTVNKCITVNSSNSVETTVFIAHVLHALLIFTASCRRVLIWWLICAIVQSWVSLTTATKDCRSLLQITGIKWELRAQHLPRRRRRRRRRTRGPRSGAATSEAATAQTDLGVRPLKTASQDVADVRQV